MNDEDRRDIFSNHYLSLFSDGEIGLSDGVGYVDTLDATEVRSLFNALKQYYANTESEEGEMLRIEEHREMRRKEIDAAILRKEVTHLRTVLQIMSDAISAVDAPWVADCYELIQAEQDRYRSEGG